jgi:hypothetical protein
MGEDAGQKIVVRGETANGRKGKTGERPKTFSHAKTQRTHRKKSWHKNKKFFSRRDAEAAEKLKVEL